MNGSAHFKPAELACGCCGANECVPLLYDALEQFRAEASKANGHDTPVIVNSGYRCAKRNAEAGGAKASQHLAGRAADIRVVGRDAEWMEMVAKRCSLINGIGRNDYNSFLHIDVRPGTFARWCYDAKGKTVAYYPPKGNTDEQTANA